MWKSKNRSLYSSIVILFKSLPSFVLFSIYHKKGLRDGNNKTDLPDSPSKTILSGVELIINLLGDWLTSIARKSSKKIQ